MANTLDFTFNGKDKTQTAFRSLNRSVSKTQKGFDKLKGAMGALAGIASIGALVGFTKNMLEVGDRIGKVAIQIGISSEALQKLQFAGEQSGVSTEALNKSLQKFARTIGEANSGMKLQKEAFQQLGISTKDLNGVTRPTVEILMDVVDALDKETDMATKAKLASDLFGRSGVELVPLLEQGSIGIKELGKELEDLNGIMGDEAVQAIQDYNDSMNLLSKMGRGIFASIVLGARDFIQALEDIGLVTEEVFHKGGDLKDGLGMDELIQAWEEVDKEIRNAKLDLAILNKGHGATANIFMTIDEIRKSIKLKEAEILKLKNKQHGIEGKMQYNSITEIKHKKVNLDLVTKTSKLIVEDLGNTKLAKDQAEAGMRISETTLQLDEKLYQVTLKDLEGKGESLGVVKGLTKEQAEQLIGARQSARVQLAQEKSLKIAKKITKDIVDEEKEKTKELKKQRAESARVAGIVLSGIRSSGASATRFFDALNIQIKQVGDSFTLAFETNWVAIVAKLVMSSKIVSGFINKLFSGVGNAIDKTIGKIFPFLTETEETFDSVDLRLKDIANMVDQLNDAQFGYMNTLRHLTDDARALTIIERDYQKNKKEAKRLNSGYLSHLADQNNMLAKMAHHISSMRRATDAFKSSVISYIDALEQSGFTNLQKELSMTLKGFIRGPLQNFNKLITESKEVSTTAKPALVEALEQETSLKALGKITDPGELITVLKGDEYLKDVFSEQLMAWEKMQSGDLSLVALGQNVEIFKKFGEVLNKELGKLGGDDGIIDVLTKSVSDASSTITTNTDLLNQASGGLTVMLKDSLKADFEAGKSKLDLVTDITAVASLLEDAGLNIKTFTDYIETLTPPDATGSMGGLFKKYPYGGKIYGPGHSGGGVNANLEGGEFVMSRSAVNKYGSDFMSSINNGSLGGQVQVNIYDGTGERISEFDSALRIEINDRAGRFNEFPALAV